MPTDDQIDAMSIGEYREYLRGLDEEQFGKELNRVEWEVEHPDHEVESAAGHLGATLLASKPLDKDSPLYHRHQALQEESRRRRDRQLRPEQESLRKEERPRVLNRPMMGAVGLVAIAALAVGGFEGYNVLHTRQGSSSAHNSVNGRTFTVRPEDSGHTIKEAIAKSESNVLTVTEQRVIVGPNQTQRSELVETFSKEPRFIYGVSNVQGGSTYEFKTVANGTSCSWTGADKVKHVTAGAAPLPAEATDFFSSLGGMTNSAYLPDAPLPLTNGTSQNHWVVRGTVPPPPNVPAGRTFLSGDLKVWIDPSTRRIGAFELHRVFTDQVGTTTIQTDDTRTPYKIAYGEAGPVRTDCP